MEDTSGATSKGCVNPPLTHKHCGLRNAASLDRSDLLLAISVPTLLLPRRLQPEDNPTTRRCSPSSLSSSASTVVSTTLLASTIAISPYPSLFQNYSSPNAVVLFFSCKDSQPLPPPLPLPLPSPCLCLRRRLQSSHHRRRCPCFIIIAAQPSFVHSPIVEPLNPLLSRTTVSLLHVTATTCSKAATFVASPTTTSPSAVTTAVVTPSVPLPYTSPSAFYCHLLLLLLPHPQYVKVDLFLALLSSLQHRLCSLLQSLIGPPYSASSSSTLITTFIINTTASFAIGVAPTPMLSLPVAAASVVPYTNAATFQP
ncbi:hypothetical protein B296_00027578 [Ensete ventricosum]|uniref:Uncharacterized protein n=1 Tax=Ensete ventricosum TaxID=4639 RepID=A0A426YJV2_ENSVE|nr:hypothetical protein B296_00027578 [Ensete ventricosum]